MGTAKVQGPLTAMVTHPMADRSETEHRGLACDQPSRQCAALSVTLGGGMGEEMEMEDVSLVFLR